MKTESQLKRMNRYDLIEYFFDIAGFDSPVEIEYYNKSEIIDQIFYVYRKKIGHYDLLEEIWGD